MELSLFKGFIESPIPPAAVWGLLTDMSKKRKTRKKGKKRKNRSLASKRKHNIWKARFSRVELAVTLMVVAAALLIIRSYLIKNFDKRIPEVEPGLLSGTGGDKVLPAVDGPCGRPEIQQCFLKPNKYSRSQIPLEKVDGVVVHYVANPGSSAMENRDYFNGLKDSHATKASSHFIIGLSGEIIQCIPLDEISYASNQRNTDTISIECCHPGADGKFSRETMTSLEMLTAWLCRTYELDSEDVIRHYDVTGKLCPIYYVRNQAAWDAFRGKVKKLLDSK